MPKLSLYARLAIVGLFILVLATLHWAGASSNIESWLISKTGNFLSRDTSLSVKVREEYRFFKSRDEFLESAAACFDHELSNTLEQIELKKLEDENSSLRSMLNFAKKSPHKFVVANVISKDISGNEQIIIIDHGSLDGLNVGMPVVVKDGIYIGSIVKISPQTSAIKLLNDNLSKVAVSVLNLEKSIGVLEGGFGISLKIRFIPRNENIHAGDKVITSGLEPNIPYGLAIGTVSVVENEAYQPFQEAVVTPLIDFSKLTIVGVMTNGE